MGSTGQRFFFMAEGNDSACMMRKRRYLAAVRLYMDDMHAAGSRFSLLASVGAMSSLGLASHYLLLERAGFSFRDYSATSLRDAIDRFMEQDVTLPC